MNLRDSGECIRRNRQQQGITLEELSGKTGIDTQILEAFEEGRYKPKYSELMKISKELHVPPIIIMRGGGECLVRDKDGKARYRQF